jgi:hypothetical protein
MLDRVDLELEAPEKGGFEPIATYAVGIDLESHGAD